MSARAASHEVLSEKGLSREVLSGLDREVAHPGNATKAAVSLYADSPIGPLVIKDVRTQHRWFRGLVGRHMLRREVRALQALDEVEGVPCFLGWVDENAFAQELRPGMPIRKRHVKSHPEAFRAGLLALQPMVEHLHAHGVVHLDLRQRRNILVAKDGTVSLIDFESALVLGTRGIKGWLLRRLSRLDRAACLKFKARYVADALTEEERRRWRRQERFARFWIFHRFGPLVRRLLGRSPDEDDDSRSNTS